MDGMIAEGVVIELGLLICGFVLLAVAVLMAAGQISDAIRDAAQAEGKQ